jgi:hypothetical protein
MDEKNYFFNGECGEQLLVCYVRLKKKGGHERKCVNIDIEGLIPDEEGNLYVTLSPHVAKRLAKELIKYAEKASEWNYRLLTERKTEE